MIFLPLYIWNNQSEAEKCLTFSKVGFCRSANGIQVYLPLVSVLYTSLSSKSFLLSWYPYMRYRNDSQICCRRVRCLSGTVRLKTYFPLILIQHYAEGQCSLHTLIPSKVEFPALILESSLLFPLLKSTAETYWKHQALCQLLALCKTFLFAWPQTSYLELAKLFTFNPLLSIDQVETVITQWSSRQPACQKHQHDTFLCMGSFTPGT